MGRTSEQTLHSFPQPFKQPGVTMETPLCMFPNYPNPLHILSHTQRVTHRNTKRHKHTLFGRTIPFPLPCIPTQSTFIPRSCQPGAGARTHSRYQQFLDLVDGPLELDLGPVVRVLHRDQDVEVLAEVLPVGLPSVHLLLETKRPEKRGLFEMHRLASPEQTGGEELCFSSPLAGPVGPRAPGPGTRSSLRWSPSVGFIDIQVRTP